MKLTSMAFAAGGKIPAKYTCDGDNINPPLEISDVPDGAKSLALIMDDPDIPEVVKLRLGKNVFEHWIAFNIPPDTTQIPEGREVGTAGQNSSGKSGYTGPCPPDREHRYFFKLYALDTTLDLQDSTDKARLEKAMGGHILGQAEIMGTFSRQ